MTEFFPFLAVLLLLGALLWAKAQDPFSRKWFTVLAGGHHVKCVAVLPKSQGRLPIVIYAHGSGGSLMEDGFELRQMAELGLAAVSFEYDQTNEAAFPGEMAAVRQYLDRQKWADMNAIAWVGFSMGANRMFALELQPGAKRPQLLVQVSGSGSAGTNFLADGTRGGRFASRPIRTVADGPSGGSPDGTGGSPVLPGAGGTLARTLLVHGEQDEIFPVDDTKQLAAVLQTNGVPVELKVIPGVSHGMNADRGVVFRWMGEYCLTHLAGTNSFTAATANSGQWEHEPNGRDAHAATGSPDRTSAWQRTSVWQDYHSIAQWQAEAPSLVWFWIPAAACVVGRLIWRRRGGETPAEGNRPTGRTARHEIALRWVAGILAVWALTETGLHLIPPHFAVSGRTLALARRFSVQPKEGADFEALAGRSIWQDQKLQTLLDHVELAGYNRELIYWRLSQKIYEDYVLSPVITGKAGEQFHWRRALWEECYPRIRHESSPEDAARIVVRHLRERVTVLNGPGLPEEVPDIWLRQLTDPAGFEILHVAALRTVGVPARLDAAGQAEFHNGEKWQAAPRPVIFEVNGSK